ncbi:major facilitator superfamily MFS_1 [Deinococcus proteolyticus MRP]|uniref:Major facilitator superfamily MFS_1 n=1 Tax=Deinococcus proteolyticus (strain ATCC 35074 / DSM 20540 / JCM 6276 / NBRC 101906 / NCIMB 13154 / VKM Ac-1939 / CCM 2703 / MRP) TaxID=693977 RepID=F0RL29_DEIPM|nr:MULTISPECIES: MFS transporter [Deinococcus]ADY25802.1 major facilitator superfamily MFS_1 [Deinococcus proteolyticus MRP]MCY1701925.1 MFS transporter [Deinococcus sp. SL84]
MAASSPTESSVPEPGGALGWLRRTFSALGHDLFRRYWSSQLLSLIGTWMQTTAQQYLVLELTGGSSAALGWVTAAQFTPSLLLSLFAGAIVDRAPRRTVLLLTQTGFLFTAAALAVSTHLEVVTLPLVLGLAFVHGVAQAFDMPARQSIVVDLVPRESVANAIALNSFSFNVSRTTGQALFGVVVAAGVALLAGGHSDALARLAFPFYLNVASFFLVMYVIATLPFPPRDSVPRGSMTEQIADGLRYVRGSRDVSSVMWLVGLLSLTVINFNIVIPYFAREVFGAREAAFGLMSAVFGLGAVAGALSQASRPDPVRFLRLGGVILVTATAAFAWVPGPALGLPLLALAGFGMLSFLVSANSTVQLIIPDELRGRVMSLYSFVLAGMGPPSAIFVSFMIGKSGPLGPHWGLSAVAALGALSLLALWKRLPRALPQRS